VLFFAFQPPPYFLKKQGLVNVLCGFGLMAVNAPKHPHFGAWDLSPCNPYKHRRGTVSLGQLGLFDIFFLLSTSQPGPGAAREKFEELISPIWIFYVTQSFLSRNPLGFWSLGYPGVQGSSCWGHACVNNLP